MSEGLADCAMVKPSLMGRITVRHFHRRPNTRHFSMERLFADVRSCLPAWIECGAVVSRFESRGLMRRLYNVGEAWVRRKNVNHITGDVHYLAFGLPRRALVLTIHDCVVLNRTVGLRRWLIRLLWFEIPVRRAAVVTTISESSRREILRFTSCAPDKIVVIPNCVSQEFSAKPRSFNAACPLILQIGTAPNKNIEALAAALSGLSCRLRIIGTPSVAQWNAIRASGIECVVHERLSAEEMTRAYTDADIVALASTYEGFGLPIVEANAVGRPVVAGNVFSIPEVAGNAACLVDPHDVESIRNGFLKVIGDREYREALVAAGFENVRRFNRDVVAEHYAAVYAMVASGEIASGMMKEESRETAVVAPTPGGAI